MSEPPSAPTRALVTGAGGYIGHKLVTALARTGRLEALVAADVRAPASPVAGVVHARVDVRDAAGLTQLMKEHGIEVVVHLAAVVSPKGGARAKEEYEIDVDGTRNVLDACLSTGARKLVHASSGAAYGYHADNPSLLREDDRLRGNDEFPYARHKRLVEELLADHRVAHPELQQLVFRPGTVLGAGVKNQITAIFEGPAVLGLSDAASPFTLVWDEDVVACLSRGALGEEVGIFNLAGDGVMTLREIAARLRKPFVGVPSHAMELALRAAKALGVAPWGPEQVRFLKYRPVLDNQRLKTVFGYTPRLSTREVFELYCASAG